MLSKGCVDLQAEALAGVKIMQHTPYTVKK